MKAKDRGISRGSPENDRKDEIKLREMTAFKVSKTLEEAEERAKLEKKQKKAILGLVQTVKYALATLKEFKLEQALVTGENPLGLTLKVYWKEEVVDERQRRLTDFL